MIEASNWHAPGGNLSARAWGEAFMFFMASVMTFFSCGTVPSRKSYIIRSFDFPKLGEAGKHIEPTLTIHAMCATVACTPHVTL